jgi:hypothetical protein
MKKAQITDKAYVLEVLENAMKNNPTLNAISRKVRGKALLNPLLEYAFYYSYARKGVFLSENRTCIAFMNFSKRSGSFTNIKYLLKLILKGISFSKILAIITHIRKIRSYKPADADYLHFWFLGSTKDSDLRSSRCFIEELLKIAERKRIPVYAETTLPKNETVFKRFGFQTYQKLVNQDLNLTTFLMKREIYTT